MSDYIQKQCPKCGQQLRFPKNVGGIVMACPTCGQKFGSDFKLGAAGGLRKRGMVVTIFELPTTLVERLFRLFRLK